MICLMRFRCKFPNAWDGGMQSTANDAIDCPSSSKGNVYLTAAHASICRWVCCFCGADLTSRQYGQVPRFSLACRPVQARLLVRIFLNTCLPLTFSYEMRDNDSDLYCFLHTPQKHYSPALTCLLCTIQTRTTAAMLHGCAVELVS